MSAIITDLVGRKKSDLAVAAFVDSLGVCRHTDAFGGLSIQDYPPLGLCLYFDEEELLVTAFVYAEGHDEHSQFRGVMPHGASFADSRSSILKRFGDAERSGPTWDRFSFSGHVVHFQYSTDEMLQMVTVMAPQMKEEPNQTLEPTTLLGTSAAEQPLVPSRVVAHL